MSAKIYLHLGTHKTGTTFLQSCLADARDSLRAQGALYPTLKPAFRSDGTAHHALAHALAGNHWKDRMRLWRFQRSFRNQMHGMMMGILSAEAIYRHTLDLQLNGDIDAWFSGHKRYLERVANYFGGYEVIPVVYFRRREDFIVSLYKEGVAIRNEAIRISLDEFAEQRAMRLDYQRHIEMLEDVFGTVCVRSYETACQAGLLKDFAEMLGLSLLDNSTLTSIKPRTRRSVGNKALRWLQAAEQAGAPSSHSRRLQFALRQHNVPPFADPAPSVLWTSAESLRDFKSRFEPSKVQAPKVMDPVSTVQWTEMDQVKANIAFVSWESANLDLLRKREKLNLRFYTPDPM